MNGDGRQVAVRTREGKTGSSRVRFFLCWCLCTATRSMTGKAWPRPACARSRGMQVYEISFFVQDLASPIEPHARSLRGNLLLSALNLVCALATLFLVFRGQRGTKQLGKLVQSDSGDTALEPKSCRSCRLQYSHRKYSHPLRGLRTRSPCSSGSWHHVRAIQQL